MPHCPICHAVLTEESTRCPHCGFEQAGAAKNRAPRGPLQGNPLAEDADSRPRILPPLGYVFVAAGSVGALLPGWSLLGGAAACVGCGIGLNVSPLARWCTGLTVAAGLAFLGATMDPSRAAGHPTLTGGDASFLAVSVESAVYRAGELTIAGTVANTGRGTAHDPALELRVFDAAGVTLLMDDTVYPSGRYAADLPPGATATFALPTLVPDRPEHIRWTLTSPDHPGEVMHRDVAQDPGVSVSTRALP